ncbi:MAG: aminopeptidase [Nanoarchaeota archaeon]
MLPSHEILQRYADVLVNFALNSGKGLQKNELVYLQIPECAKPLLKALQITILKAGGHYITQFIPDNITRHFYEHASEEQIAFFPDKYLKGRVDQADHFLMIIAEADKQELRGIDPKKIMARSKVFKPYMDWRTEKENAGKLTWTLALYGTEAMAQEASLSLEDYWDQIIKACYLDDAHPVQRWKEVFAEIERVRTKLNQLPIEKVRVIASGTDLTVGIGPGRTWLGGSGRNIPSFEVYVSPHAHKTEGHITFNQPLYRYGNLIKNVYLEFKNGRVTKATASQGEDVLKEMIATENADRIGEFSLTDKRLSRVNKCMAETLFDENMGGPYGNTHIALGAAYKDSYPGDPATLTKEQWEELGYNDSVVHTDIVSTENREVIATLADGTEKTIYKDGQFVL